MATRYYSENLAKVPFKLLYHAIKQSMPAPLAWGVAGGLWLLGKLGLRLPPSHGVGFIGSERAIDPGELPAGAVAKWAPLLEQLRDLGFIPLRTQATPTVGAKLQYSTLLLQEATSTVAILEWTRQPGAKGFDENVVVEFNAYADSGPDIVTGVVRPVDEPMSQMLKIDSVEMVSLANNRPLAERHATHLRRRDGRRFLGLSEEDALRVADERNRLRFDALLKQGILRELTPAEIERLQQADVTGLHNG